MSYGSIPPVGKEAPRRNGRAILAAVGALILVAIAVVSQSRVSGSVELEAKKAQAWSYDWAGESVPVPRSVVNYKAGTLTSQHGEFENSAMDKARPTQLAEAGKHKAWAYNWNQESVPVPPSAAVNFKAGTTVSSHGEFENSAQDKARPMQLAAQKHFHGLSTKSADSELDAYFASQAKAAAKKQTPPKAVTFTARDATKDLTHYFASEAKVSKQPQQQLRLIPTSHKIVHPPTKFGKSSASADADLAGYFHEQAILAAKPRVAAKPVQKAAATHSAKGPKHGYSASKSDADLAKYFESQQAVAAKKQVAMKPAKQQLAAKGKAPKYGLSDRAADKDVNAYFQQQQKLAEQVNRKDREVECIGSICTDKTLDAPLWGRSDDKLPDHLVDAGKADCTEDMDCESSRSPLLFKSRKVQKLSAYGVGAEDDNSIEVGKAIGVDATQPSSVMEANEPPSEDTIKEVNDAISSQRNDRYTNGNGMPVEKVEAPPAK